MSSAPPPVPEASTFDLAGPLPTGNTILEASAGTGKTYTIAALAARYVAAGLPIDQLLVVSFTRLATGELRERVRERLLASELCLAQALAGGECQSADPVSRLLCGGDRVEVRERQQRLAAALTDFDRATIETTHSFCQRMLSELGTLGDHEPGIRFVDDVDAMRDEVVDDLYLQLFSTARSVAPIGLDQAAKIALARARDPRAQLYPLTPAQRSPEALRRWLAERSWQELEARKRRLRVMTHEDQLTRLAAVLEGPNGARAAARLRARFTVVLIDEFQDTDPVQWEILRRAFADGPGTLVLIGDPKQAIYSFRGGDVYTYLAAARHVPQHATLNRNHRSDEPLLKALNTLFADARLGHPEIPYRPLQATAANRQARITGSQPQPPLRIRYINGEAPIARTPTGRYFDTPSTHSFVSEDVASEIAKQLNGAVMIADAGDDAVSASPPRPLAPGDIAVLVREHRQADAVHTALLSRGVPAVISGGGSVFLTRAADDWLSLLAALERPTDRSRAARAALSTFIAWDGEQLALADEATTSSLQLRLYHWARLLRERGVAAMTAAIVDGEGLPARLLAQSGGDRILTDIEHISELLHQRASRDQLGLAALTNWLRERIATATAKRAGEELERRLDSDAAAVHVMTIHAAKGLEFPIVYCPYLWNGRKYATSQEPLHFHVGDRSGVRAIDVSLAGREFEEHALRQLDEERAEDLRLLYVALTRARHQVVLWWTGGPFNAFESPLGRLLFAADERGNIAAKAPRQRPSEQAVVTRLSELARQGEGTIVLEPAIVGSDHSELTIGPSTVALERARFDRDLDFDWRRTSYSALTAAAHGQPIAAAPPSVRAEPDGAASVDDERSVAVVQAAESSLTGPDLSSTPAAVASVPTLPLAAMAAGPALGTIVHRALELVEFDCPKLDRALAVALAEANVAAEQILGCPLAVAAHGLALALATPLGGTLGTLALSALARHDRLDELSFDLPLASGGPNHQALELAQLADTLAEFLPADDPLATYPARLRALDLANRPLRGCLTGTIDLVARVIDPITGRARFHVLDYKTNRLAPPDVALSADHYRPAALRAEMQRSHYVLQGLLYGVAVHRYLRWRVPDYEPATDLGSIHYLFLRGMTGPLEPSSPDGPNGIFAWQPPAPLIVRLSEVIDGA